MNSHLRLAATKTGIGVITSAPIKKGRRIDAWEPGDMVYVDLESITDMDYLKWLNVFGIVVWKGFYAPKNPMRMSIAWYINHSSKPNLDIRVTPSTWTIRAKRDIKSGEQLTVDYGTLDFRVNGRRK
jgi:hypothetical protein